MASFNNPEEALAALRKYLKEVRERYDDEGTKQLDAKVWEAIGTLSSTAKDLEHWKKQALGTEYK